MIARPAPALPQKGNYNYLVRTDASDFTISATLRQLQFGEQGPEAEPIERIIAYFSRELRHAETRYSTYKKELVGVRNAIEHWKYYLKSGHKFRAQTDQSALQHILVQPKLTGRQLRLLETLQEYDFDVEFYPGIRNYIQDALSRRSDYTNLCVDSPSTLQYANGESPLKRREKDAKKRLFSPAFPAL